MATWMCPYCLLRGVSVARDVQELTRLGESSAAKVMKDTGKISVFQKQKLYLCYCLGVLLFLDAAPGGRGLHGDR